MNLAFTLKNCTKNESFPLRIYSVNVTKSARNCGLVTFTEEILNGKLHFLCSEDSNHVSRNFHFRLKCFCLYTKTWKRKTI